MKLDTPATDWCDDEITAIGDELLMTRWRAHLTKSSHPGWTPLRIAATPTTSQRARPSERLQSGRIPQSSTETDMLSMLVLDEWDPVRFEHEEPSSQGLVRFESDLQDLFTNPLTGVYIETVTVGRFHVVVVGPSGTPYEGGFFHFLMQCPKDYPMRPPRVRLMNTDDGSVSFSPNLYKSGRVCLDILGTSGTLAWSPAHSISSVVVSIQSLLTEKPHFNEPQWISEARSEDGGSYSRIVQHETIRVAVCDAIEACLNGSSLCPGYLQGVMLEHFIAYYEEYVKVVESNLDLTGADMMEPLFFETYERGQYQYESLLVKLRKMKAQVEDFITALHVGENEWLFGSCNFLVYECKKMSSWTFLF
ncbi:ubiquitin-conjugating enzyme E2 Z [Rhipicephalus sanguineus]|uniref:ubiquitin-conjugating enzyme E2 Z n=1 Tax=Rhipicephalus sanguineus TaxID=34632 RepID=UPI001894B2B7|nr:ubiquitin-conjugating enzyme E2 Z [Rhipicephalus sanguineus]